MTKCFILFQSFKVNYILEFERKKLFTIHACFFVPRTISRPEMLTSGWGVRRWEMLGDELGRGKLVLTQTDRPGPGLRERERKYPSFAKSWYFSDFSKYLRFPPRCPLSYWAMMPWPVTVSDTRHSIPRALFPPPHIPHYNGHNFFVASDPE